MRHSIEWRNDADNAAPEERGSVGDLRLYLNNQNVTQHLLEDRVGDHVTVALYGLVDGLAHDWWSIWGARDREFSLATYRSGFLLPDIRFSFDGAALEIAAHQRVYVDPSLRFWGGTAEVLSRDDGEAWLASLVEDVLGRLSCLGFEGTGAALRWARVQVSRRGQDRAFCEAAGALGVDPYRIADDVAGFIEDAEAVFRDEALSEFVSGASDVDGGRLMSWIGQMMRENGARYRLGNLRRVVDDVVSETPSRESEAAWAKGYRLARATRKTLGLEQHRRFSSFMDLARLFGAGKSYELAPAISGISALRREAVDGVRVHLRNHGDGPSSKATHLFALTRAIGDAFCFPSPETAPINKLHRACRQAAGRAFAAEFLAPIDEISSMLSDRHDEYSIADELGVAPIVVALQIENRNRIASACAFAT